MDLTTPAGLASVARDVAELLQAERAEPGDGPDRQRVTYADGRILELIFNRPPSTHVTITPVLPDSARTHGIEVPPITVYLPTRSRQGDPAVQTPAQILADQIRSRTEAMHTVALAELSKHTAP
ncbi:hypothetical protein ACIP5U_37335 [Streptomyces sp. NPDC088788]|uniref:hypothetical protein n=1 Tax=Streptomyces sp. NPDC088788 TaxID=3365898 RepID=UPI0037F38BD8